MCIVQRFEFFGDGAGCRGPAIGAESPRRKDHPLRFRERAEAGRALAGLLSGEFGRDRAEAGRARAGPLGEDYEQLTGPLGEDVEQLCDSEVLTALRGRLDAGADAPRRTPAPRPPRPATIPCTPVVPDRYGE